MARLERARPRILGALLDVVAGALIQEPTVTLEKPPRMADFARWTAAACRELRRDADAVLNAYATNRVAASQVGLESSPLVAPLREVCPFEGTATELLAELTERVSENQARAKGWPRAANVLSGQLKRLAPTLRMGDPPIDVAFFSRHDHQRMIRLVELEEVRSGPSPSSPSSPGDTLGGDRGGGDDGSPTRSNGSVDEITAFELQLRGLRDAS